MSILSRAAWAADCLAAGVLVLRVAPRVSVSFLMFFRSVRTVPARPSVWKLDFLASRAWMDLAMLGSRVLLMLEEELSVSW